MCVCVCARVFVDVCTGVLAVVTVLAIDGLYYLAASFSSSLSPDDVHDELE